MRERSFGVTTLAFAAVMIGLYCQFAAIALILTGSVYTPTGSMHASVALMNGALFFGLTFASYFLAYGLWTKKQWSWAGGIAVFAVLVVANLMLSLVAANFVSSVLPAAAAVAGVWYLNRPAIKAELLGTAVPVETKVSMPDVLEVAEPVH